MNAQQVSQVWGEEFKAQGGMECIIKSFDFDRKNQFVITNNALNKNLITTFTAELTPANIAYTDNLVDDYYFKGVFRTNKGIFALFFNPLYQTNWEIMTARYIEGKFETPITNLNIEVDGQTTFYKYYNVANAISKGPTESESFAINNAGTFIAVATRVYKGKEPLSWMVAVFDADMNPVWQMPLEIDQLGIDPRLLQMRIDNSGQVIFLGRGIVDAKTNLSIIFCDKGEFNRVSIPYRTDLAGMHLWISASSPDRLLFASTYRQIDTSHEVHGLLLGLGSIKDKQIHMQEFPFADSTVKALNKFNKQPDSTEVLKDIIFDHLIEFQNLNFALVAERRNSTTDSYTIVKPGDAQSYSSTYNNFKQGVIPYFSPDGNLLSMPIIQKSSVAIRSHAGSYVLNQYKDRLYYIYEDRVTSEESEELKSQKIKSHSALRIVSLDSSGKMEAPAAVHFVDNNHWRFIHAHSPNSLSQLTIGTMSLSKCRMGRITFE